MNLNHVGNNKEGKVPFTEKCIHMAKLNKKIKMII